MTMTNDIQIGIIGGSGLYDMAEVTGREEKTISTPFGDPSGPELQQRLNRTILPQLETLEVQLRRQAAEERRLYSLSLRAAARDRNSPERRQRVHRRWRGSRNRPREFSRNAGGLGYLVLSGHVVRALGTGGFFSS